MKENARFFKLKEYGFTSLKCLILQPFSPKFLGKRKYGHVANSQYFKLSKSRKEQINKNRTNNATKCCNALMALHWCFSKVLNVILFDFSVVYRH